MRVLLVHPVHEEPGSPHPFRFINIMPVGLFSLADRLDREGHEVAICHLGLQRHLDPSWSLADRVRDADVDVVGISLHWTLQLAEVCAAAAEIKAARPTVSVVLGGITASLFAREILEAIPEVDYVIQGDGELPILHLLEAHQRARLLADCANLHWRAPDGTVQAPRDPLWTAEESDLGSLYRPELLAAAERYRPPYFHLPGDPAEAYVGSDLFYLVAHRGCPHACDYCGGCRGAQRRLRRGRFTRLPAARLVSTARQALADGFRRLYLLADNAVLGDRYLLEVARGLAREQALTELHLDVYQLPAAGTLQAIRAALPHVALTLHLSPEAGSDARRADRRPAELFFTNRELAERLREWYRADVRLAAYFSLHPAYPEAEIQAIGRLVVDLAAREGNRICVFPLDLDPASPWATAPEQHRIARPVADLEGLLALDARRGREGTRYPRDLGYRYDALVDHLVALDRIFPLRGLDNTDILEYTCAANFQS